ncbi:hypothetical protein LTR36_004314 [Oleoguttula mirabilis]|uniref:Large ribosomal subunit protein uL23m n=1 Tax=Oleoguttula mirabilis TaxID=1507867 RepID=A0AAV9JHH4_9PEZI|nr:hypothetical protein LTR36_004314 [Oleoguttula mirabilis]
MAAHAPFKVGMKEIYLPTFKLVFKRTKHLPANYASFIVPLWFSKLDLRDYLYHGYNVRVGPVIRSYVEQGRIRQGQVPEPSRPQYKRWHRPRGTKHMTVELERPFAWPERPTDLTPWNKEETTMASEEQQAYGEKVGPQADQKGVGDDRRVAMREQAKALLEGKEKWKPGLSRGVGMAFGR